VAGRNVDFVNTIPGRCALSVNDPNLPAPRGWAWIKLTDIARLESGHTPSRNHPEYWDGEIAWIGIKDAREHHSGVINDTLQHVTQAGLDNSAARLLPAKTVCLSRTASVGYVIVMGRPMATSQDFVNWVCTPALEPDYLKWLLLAEGPEGLRKFGKGSTHTTIYFPEVQAFHVCVAPLNEQRRIVAKLDAIFEQTRAAKARLERLPALLEKLKRSILAAAFRGDLTKDWRAAHPNLEPAPTQSFGIESKAGRLWGSGASTVRPLRRLPDGWRWAQVRELGPNAVQIGPMSMKSNEFTDSGTTVLNVGCVQWGRLELSKCDHLPETRAADFERYRIRAGDVLFTRSGTVGRTALATNAVDGALITFHLLRIRAASEVCRPGFLYLALRGAPEVRDAINEAAVGATRAGFNTRLLEDLWIPLPPLGEQKEIESRLDVVLAAADEIRGRITRGEATAIEFERAALAKAFRGELVTQDPTDEPAASLLERIRTASAAETKFRLRVRGQLGDNTRMPDGIATDTSDVRATNGHHDEALDLVVGAFQIDRRLTTTAITAVTGLDASSVKKALKVLVETGQVRVHGRASGTTYEWGP
jgi:restriction endonuclease S subunit